MDIAIFRPIAGSVDLYKGQASPTSTVSSQSASPVSRSASPISVGAEKITGMVTIERADRNLPAEIFRANDGPGAYLIQHDAPKQGYGLDRYIIEDYSGNSKAIKSLKDLDIQVFEGEDPKAVARLVAGLHITTY